MEEKTLPKRRKWMSLITQFGFVPAVNCINDLKRDLVVGVCMFCDSREVGQVSDVLVLFNQMGLPADRFNGFLLR